MAQPVISGQSLHDELLTRIGGYANAFNSDELMSFINEGMHEVWKELKSLRRNYFVVTTQATDSALSTYLAALSTSTREFTLPEDLREIRAIAVSSPAGYEWVEFTRKDISSPEFLAAQRDATAGGSAASQGLDEYLYDIINERTLVFAQFPQAAFVLAIRYVYALPELTLGVALDGIISPWHFKILDWAAKKAVLAKHNETMTDEWRDEWRAATLSIASGASQRDTATPQVVVGFMED